MLKVGLTGGLATGKSFVGRRLVELGCHLLHADQVGHQVLMPGGAAYAGVVAEFGRGILDADGCIARKRLGEIVFRDPQRLETLNSLVHPAVFARVDEWFDELAAQDNAAIAIVEAAIMIETGSYVRYDRLILTVCREDLQISRARERDGLTEIQIRDRLSRQMPESEKRKYADYIIDTSGTPDETLEQTARVCALLKGSSL